jgi:beta-glucanase (GH16 family)
MGLRERRGDAEGRLALTALRTGSDEITSVRLTTRGRVTVMYGRMEAGSAYRAAQARGRRSGWLGEDLDEVGWPARGEIDVMEVVGSDPRRVHGTIHLPGAACLRDGLGRAFDGDVDLAADLHTYAVDW